MSHDAASVNQTVNGQDDVSRHANSSKSVLVGFLIAGAILSTGVFEYAVYQHYFKRYIAPYYPVNSDQLTTYRWAYKNSFGFKTGIREKTEDKPVAQSSMHQPGLNMKGPVVLMLSEAAVLVMGPHRFSVGLINFLYLILGQIVLFLTLRRRSGLRAALIASGLFLLSGTHYLYAGGINDMRLDYAGMITMGITYLTVLQWLEQGKRTDLLLVALCLLLCATTRSILMIYWIGTALSALVLFFLAGIFDKSLAPRQYRNRTALLLACLAGIAGLYVAMNWHDFASYYINCKTGGEDAMRRHENNVENLPQMLLYYPRSFLQHFHTMLLFGFGTAAVSLAGWLSEALRLRKTGEPFPGLTRKLTVTPAIALLIGIVSSVLVCVTSYAPSPLVIGVLTMPLCISLALVAEHFLKLSKLKSVPMAIAAVVAMCGLVNFNNEFKHPIYPPHPDQHEAQTVNRISETLIPEVNRSGHRVLILWALVHSGLNQDAFEIYAWEHLHKPLAVPVDAAYMAAYPQFSWSELQHRLAEADIVVVPIELAKLAPQEFEYDAMKSLRENLPKMLVALKSDNFVQIGAYRLYENRPPLIGIFERHPKQTSN